jgi:hypothetical protein
VTIVPTEEETDAPPLARLGNFGGEPRRFWRQSRNHARWVARDEISRGVIETRHFRRPTQKLNDEQLAEFMDRVEKRRKSQLKDPGQSVSTGKKEKAMSLRKILKSSGEVTREQIEAAVEKKAQKIAKRDGISLPKAMDQVWFGKGAEAAEAYSRMRSKPKTEPTMTRLTEAESELDERARKLMKKTPGTSYAKAVSQVLDEHPEIYDAYEKQISEGKTFLAPEHVIVPPESSSSKFYEKRCKQGDADADDEDGFGDCPHCGKPVDMKMAKFCHSCGKALKSKAS